MIMLIIQKILLKILAQNPYEGNIEEGMVLAIESYMGPIGESNGVKLEEQILVTKEGHEILSSYPFEESLLE